MLLKSLDSALHPSPPTALGPFSAAVSLTSVELHSTDGPASGDSEYCALSLARGQLHLLLLFEYIHFLFSRMC